MRVLDTFAGIGGFSLGLERAGMETVAFVEIDDYCRKVLAKNWPDIPQYRDIRDVTAQRLSADGISVDVITGGFPCQDISTAGKGAGIDGERSGLWSELARVIGDVRPRYAIMENVAALLGRGMDRVAGDLAEIGYDCEWHCIPASNIGAPHRRDRIWIISYPNGDGFVTESKGQSRRSRTPLNSAVPLSEQRCPDDSGSDRNPESIESSREAEQSRTKAVADANKSGQRSDSTTRRSGGTPETRNNAGGSGEDVADAERKRSPGSRKYEQPLDTASPTIGQAIELIDGGFGDFWAIEPDVGRVANGIPKRVDRLRCLGNAIVPQIAELLGRTIIETVVGKEAVRE